jgi:hypothetical protein
MLKALFRFFQLSCVSFVTSFGLTLALHEWGQLPEEAAFAVALAVVLILNFVGMRWYIYEAQSGTILQQFGLYLCSAWAFRGADTALFSSGIPGGVAIIAWRWWVSRPFLLA